MYPCLDATILYATVIASMQVVMPFGGCTVMSMQLHSFELCHKQVVEVLKQADHASHVLVEVGSDGLP